MAKRWWKFRLNLRTSRAYLCKMEVEDWIYSQLSSNRLFFHKHHHHHTVRISEYNWRHRIRSCILLKITHKHKTDDLKLLYTVTKKCCNWSEKLCQKGCNNKVCMKTTTPRTDKKSYVKRPCTFAWENKAIIILIYILFIFIFKMWMFMLIQ